MYTQQTCILVTVVVRGCVIHPVVPVSTQTVFKNLKNQNLNVKSNSHGQQLPLLVHFQDSQQCQWGPSVPASATISACATCFLLSACILEPKPRTTQSSTANSVNIPD